MKASNAPDAQSLLQIPDIGAAMAADLHRLRITLPAQLAGGEPFLLHTRLCELDGTRHDPCVLDTSSSAGRFVEGRPPLPWWRYTKEQETRYPGL